MNKTLNKILLTVILVCGAVTAAWADGWKLSGTTAYGVGGYWENGQKTRVDCSYKKGLFQYERKVSSGTKMSVYSTKAVFSEPEQRYAPGGTISINVNFTQKGESQGYAPYARVTVVPRNPNWTKGASNRIPASGNVDGQATDALGRSIVAPSKTATFTAKAPSSGSQMAIVYSCNGMDVVYLYDWDGAVVAQDRDAGHENASFDEQPDNEETTVVEEETTETEEEATTVEKETATEEETTMAEETTQEEEVMEEEEPVTEETMDKVLLKMIIKLVFVGVVASLLIVLIIIVFKKKK